MAELHASTPDTAEIESQPTKPPDPVLNNLIYENPIKKIKKLPNFMAIFGSHKL